MRIKVFLLSLSLSTWSISHHFSLLGCQRFYFVVPNKWNNSRLDLCISIGELVEPLYKNHIKKITYYWQLAYFTASPKRKVDLTHLWHSKIFSMIVWYFRHLEYKFRTLFELKNNSKIEDSVLLAKTCTLLKRHALSTVLFIFKHFYS